MSDKGNRLFWWINVVSLIAAPFLFWGLYVLGEPRTVWFVDLLMGDRP